MREILAAQYHVGPQGARIPLRAGLQRGFSAAPKVLRCVSQTAIPPDHAHSGFSVIGVAHRAAVARDGAATARARAQLEPLRRRASDTTGRLQYWAELGTAQAYSRARPKNTFSFARVGAHQHTLAAGRRRRPARTHR